MKVLKQVIFLSIGFLPAFSLMLVQAWWMILLCDEPVISNIDEFIPFLIYSLIILFLYLLIKKKKAHNPCRYYPEWSFLEYFMGYWFVRYFDVPKRILFKPNNNYGCWINICYYPTQPLSSLKKAKRNW